LVFVGTVPWSCQFQLIGAADEGLQCTPTDDGVVVTGGEVAGAVLGTEAGGAVGFGIDDGGVGRGLGNGDVVRDDVDGRVDGTLDATGAVVLAPDVVVLPTGVASVAWFDFEPPLAARMPPTRATTATGTTIFAHSGDDWNRLRRVLLKGSPSRESRSNDTARSAVRP
jgi:hypothetical protein